MITPNSRGQMLQPFAFNSDATNINFTLTHFYDENCGLLSYLMPFVITMSLFMLGVAIAWFMFVFKLWEQQNFLIQKWLLVIPVCKSVFFGQIILNYAACPWVEENLLLYLAIFSQ
jgi:hypothetical protein